MLKIMAVISIFGVLTGCAANKKHVVEPEMLDYQNQVQSYREEVVQDYSYQPMESVEKYLEEPEVKLKPKCKLKQKHKQNKQVNLSSKKIQRALKNAGFYKGAIDGKIGAKTRNAIIKFQRSKGLKADGIVGKKTSCELNKYLIR